MSRENTARASFGAAAQRGFKGKLPLPYPRTMGPNALKYLQEVVDSGLTSDIVDRFERTFAAKLGVKHCMGAPGARRPAALAAEARARFHRR